MDTLRGTPPSRRPALVRIALAIMLPLLFGGCADRNAARPHKVILISVDTLRADYLGTYGGPVGLTPAIDQFAASAMVFEDAITSATSTLPSHTSLFYSLHTFVHNAYTGNPPDPQVVSPVEALRQAGLSTAAYVGGGQLRPVFGLDRGFETYEVVNTRNINRRTQGKDRLADLQRAAAQFLDAHGDDPFFLFLHTYEPHFPYDAPDRFLDEVRALDADLLRNHDPVPETIEVAEDVGVPAEAREVPERRLHYASEVRYVDDFLGALLAELDRRSLSQEVIVVLLSDHGESLGERGLIGHNRFTTEQLRVPLLIRVPGATPGRTQVPTELIDVMPTIYALLGQEPPYPFMGLDLSSVLHGDGPGPSDDRVRFSENKGQAAVVQRPWKVVFDLEDRRPIALYNLESDPDELTDVAPENPDVTRRLLREYQRLTFQHATLPDLFPRQGQALELDEETLRDLRTLGYVR